MTGNGDITDAFDDDALRRAVEEANDAGRWRNNGPEFQDPKIKALLQKLSKPKPEPEVRAEARRPKRKPTATPAPSPPPPTAAPRPMTPTTTPPSFEPAPHLDLDAFERDLSGAPVPIAAGRLQPIVDANLDAFERDLSIDPPVTGGFQPAPEINLDAFERDLAGAPAPAAAGKSAPAPEVPFDAFERDLAGTAAPGAASRDAAAPGLSLASFERGPMKPNAAAAAPKPPSTAAWNLASYEREVRAPPPILEARPRNTVGNYARAILAASGMFVAVVLIHAIVGGWRADLVARAIGASALTGITWQVFDAGRFRAAALGVGAHLLLFATTAHIGEVQQMIALGIGALVTLLGSTLLGMNREQGRGLALRR